MPQVREREHHTHEQLHTSNCLSRILSSSFLYCIPHCTIPFHHPITRERVLEMAVSRTNFRRGDRVRGAEWFDQIAGAVGTVVDVFEFRGDDWAAQDILVRFDRPVVIHEDEGPCSTFGHSAHNFEFADETRTAPAREYNLTDPPPKRRRLTHKQTPPPAYHACGGCRYLGYECTCAEDAFVEDLDEAFVEDVTEAFGEGIAEAIVEDVAEAPTRFVPFSGTPHRL